MSVAGREGHASLDNPYPWGYDYVHDVVNRSGSDALCDLWRDAGNVVVAPTRDADSRRLRSRCENHSGDVPLRGSGNEA